MDALIKWLRFTRLQYYILWQEIEYKLRWEEDTISGVDLDTFTESELTSMKYALLKIIREKHHLNLGPVDV